MRMPEVRQLGGCRGRAGHRNRAKTTGDAAADQSHLGRTWACVVPCTNAAPCAVMVTGRLWPCIPEPGDTETGPVGPCTVKPLTRVSTSVPVVTVTVRVPNKAFAEIVICAVKLVGLGLRNRVDRDACAEAHLAGPLDEIRELAGDRDRQVLLALLPRVRTDLRQHSRARLNRKAIGERRHFAAGRERDRTRARCGSRINV